MAKNDVLLLKPIEGIGDEGEQVKVKAGYARNYLFPKKLAVPMTQANRKQLEALQRAREARKTNELAAAEALAARFARIHLAIPVKTGPGGRLFGSVTAADLQARLADEGVEVSRKQMPVYKPVRTLGKHSTKVRLHADVQVDFEFDVVSENPIDGSEGTS